MLSDHCVLHFPPGTLRQARYPVTQVDRFTITLPDGYVLYESTSMRPHGFSSVRFAFDEFPEWVQQKYGERRNGE